MNNKMTSTEKRAVFSLSLIMSLRMIGLFMIVPVFSLYAKDLSASTPLLIGLAMGIYGLTQAGLQIPFGMLSDHLGRRPIIVAGLLLFALGSLIAALSTSIYGVVLGRALQGGGAIGSTLMAMVADLTQEENRTKAMAISGMTIGLSFALAMVLGPFLTQWLSFQGLFWLACLFSLSGILILYAYTPSPKQLSFHPETEPQPGLFFSLLKKPDLLRLNAGIFILHAILTANYVALPICLKNLGWQGSSQWKLYLPLLFVAFSLSLVFIIAAEKQRRLKPYFLGAILGLALAEASLAYFSQNALIFVLGLGVFFTAFSLLEAFLPSLVTRTAPAARKGTALGLYSTSQFLGIFVGGLAGGWINQYLGLLPIYLFSLGLGLLWFGIAYRMNSPRYLMTRTLKLAELLNSPGKHGAWTELAEELQKIPGIAEITFLPEEKVAYLRLEKETLKHPDYLRIENLVKHPH